jgi:hypothetical protein
MVSKNHRRTGNSMANQTAGHGASRAHPAAQPISERSNNMRGGQQEHDQRAETPGNTAVHERTREAEDTERVIDRKRGA